MPIVLSYLICYLKHVICLIERWCTCCSLMYFFIFEFVFFVLSLLFNFPWDVLLMTIYNIGRRLVELALQSMDFLRSQGQLLWVSWRGLLLDAGCLRKPGKVAFRIPCLKISYLQLWLVKTMLHQHLLKTCHLLIILSKNVHYQVLYFCLVLFVFDVFSMI